MSAPGASADRGLSTGAKVAIGCGAVAALGIVAIIVTLAVGGWFLKERAEDVGAGLERQAEASETLDRLRRAHPFEPPEDGVVAPGRAETFFAVTDDAWDGMREWAEEVEGLSRGGAGVTDLAAGLRGVGGLARSRTVLAGALDEGGMSLGEYVWTGLALLRAHEAARRPPEERDEIRSPEANRELARRHGERLRELARGADVDRSVVLGLATMWSMSDPGSWRALGLDTLAAGR